MCPRPRNRGGPPRARSPRRGRAEVVSLAALFKRAANVSPVPANAVRAELIPPKGEPLLLKRDVTVLGRKRDVCDVILERESISALHCVLVKTDGLLFVRDLGSTNGTTVNGQRITRGALLPNDELGLGGVKFRVKLGPGRDGRPDATEEVARPPETA